MGKVIFSCYVMVKDIIWIFLNCLSSDQRECETGSKYMKCNTVYAVCPRTAYNQPLISSTLCIQVVWFCFFITKRSSKNRALVTSLCMQLLSVFVFALKTHTDMSVCFLSEGWCVFAFLTSSVTGRALSSQWYLPFSPIKSNCIHSDVMRAGFYYRV